MKVEYINPFLSASAEMIDQVTGFKTKMGKIYIKDAPYMSESILVLIGITGGFHGSVVMTFSKEICCKLASAMMGCPLISELDEIAKSAIAELCNMILGHTATLFSRKEIIVDITPPTILTGDNIQFSIPNTVVVCIPLIFEDESQIQINVSFAENVA
ncbi:chemotaxis protein CheX [Desulfosporosinus hippei]|uniref:Chemotaxis protein CheX n=1 Tax=Desulfosporosinus hippei DSM 8344 TaxID=1121419 RepID=A0A1G7WAY1_9FIRM|nr:chemotaxis protein CheX [Desulfosporosinus hippei]SDG69071.1 chemotaxis protein CheX [Desulfosporosinus hippei DSM 8344]